MAENDDKADMVPEESKSETVKTDELLKALKDKDRLLEEKENQIENLKIEIIKLKESVRKEGELLSREADRKFRKEKGNLIKEFLEINDNFERALSSVDPSEERSKDGLLLIKNQMDKFLVDAGVKEMDLVGKAFDPNLCEIGEIIYRDDVEPNTILKVMRKGYYLDDSILRTAVVSVAVHPTDNNTENGGV
ncbi:MAG: nucleotide exchange factor GrpE [Caldisericaceae bacterium]